MFFKDIDSWTKKKLWIITAIVASLYFIAATVIPVIIVASNYNLFGKSSNYKLTAAGIIVIIILLTAGRKAFKWITSMMPQENQKQQIIRYSIELVFAMFIPACALYCVHLFKVNTTLASQTAQACIISFMFAIVIDNVAFKTLRYQHQCLNEVGHKEKIERIQQAQNNNNN